MESNHSKKVTSHWVCLIVSIMFVQHGKGSVIVLWLVGPIIFLQRRFMRNLLFSSSLKLFPMTCIIKITCLLNGVCSYFLLSFIHHYSTWNVYTLIPRVSWIAKRHYHEPALEILSQCWLHRRSWGASLLATELWLRGTWFLGWITFENRESLNQYKITLLFSPWFHFCLFFWNGLVSYNRPLVSCL